MSNKKETNPQVAIVMGSDSDLPIMEGAKKILDNFGVSSEMKVLSAHRSPDLTREYAKSAKDRGLKVIIAGAGGAAHLAGIVAAHATLPVIGVPIATGKLKGIDSLLSTVQMPSGVPVASMGIGKSGAKNAAILAVQILAISDESLSHKLDEYKKDLEDSIRQKQSKIEGSEAG